MQERLGAAEDQPEHDRDIAERERVRPTPEVEMDDAALGDRERDRDRPPRQVRVRERLKAVHRAGVERHGGGDQQEIQTPNGVDVASTAERPRQAGGRLGLWFGGGFGSHPECADSCCRQPFA